VSKSFTLAAPLGRTGMMADGAGFSSAANV